MTKRLVALFVGLTLVVLLVHDLPLIAHLREVERDRLITALERDAFTLAGLAEEDLEALEADRGGDREFLDDLAAAYADDSGSMIVIVDRDAVVMSSTDSAVAADSDLGDRPSIVLALDGVRNTGSRERLDDGTTEIYVAVPVLSGPERRGAVEFARPASAVDSRAWARQRAILVAAVISLLLAGAMGWVLARTFTEPLRRLRRATRRISDGELGARAEIASGPSEIRDLASDFNRMVERLEQVLADQRSFAGDASHQLRTPLTTLGLRVDELLARPTHEPETRVALEAARGELRRMEHLVEGLLALARAGGTDAPLVVVDVSAIVAERAEQWEPLASERGVRLVADVASGLRARAVDGALEQIIDSYIDNALEIAPEGSELQVVASRDGTMMRVDVVDAGPGLDDAELPHVFERFWRGREATPGGSGVGLAIVARLAAASGGRVALAHAGGRPRSGIAARVWLPGAAADA
jgi:signal transduction histidine kinase